MKYMLRWWPLGGKPHETVLEPWQATAILLVKDTLCAEVGCDCCRPRGGGWRVFYAPSFRSQTKLLELLNLSEPDVRLEATVPDVHHNAVLERAVDAGAPPVPEVRPGNAAQVP